MVEHHQINVFKHRWIVRITWSQKRDIFLKLMLEAWSIKSLLLPRYSWRWHLCFSCYLLSMYFLWHTFGVSPIKSIIVWTSKEFNSTIIKSQIAKNVIIALLKTIRVNFQYGISELLIWWFCKWYLIWKGHNFNYSRNTYIQAI